jgi:leucyl aminopeptidase (aminopeptidase T)
LLLYSFNLKIICFSFFSFFFEILFRECQVEHWPKHKKACDLMMEALKKAGDESEHKSKAVTDVQAAT